MSELLTYYSFDYIIVDLSVGITSYSVTQKRELQNTENSVTRPSTSARIVKFYSCVCLYV